MQNARAIVDRQSARW